MKFLRHIEHCLERGAENVLGLGADFDGMDESPFDDARCYPEIAKLLETELNLNPSLVEKIMYKNLLDFTLKMI